MAGRVKPKKAPHRSDPFRVARRQHSSEAAEDYTELILDLVERDGEARTCRIAEELGVSHVTALRTMRRLQSEGYLRTAPHRPVVLTRKGESTARYAKERHQLLVNFFIELGVPSEIAEVDAEGAEHHMSPKTLRCIRAFLERR